MSKDSASGEGRHPIQVVARRTGLSADSIRAWERRYGAVSPARSPTSRRLYSDRDIERLLLLRWATLAGRRIGDVAGLPSGELAELVRGDEVSESQAPRTDSAASESLAAHLEETMAAIGRLDGPGLEASLNRAAIELSVPALLEDFLLPLMQAVGARWQEGSIGVYHEHLATALVRPLLEFVRSGHSRPFPAPDIVLTTPAGQPHELGALMAAVVAAVEGWRTTYLGPNLPAPDIASAAVGRNARAVGISISYEDRGTERELAKLVGLLPDDVTLFVGGRASGRYVETVEGPRTRRVRDLREFRSELRLLRSNPPYRPAPPPDL